jgi:hypothetical protein
MILGRHACSSMRRHRNLGTTTMMALETAGSQDNLGEGNDKVFARCSLDTLFGSYKLIMKLPTGKDIEPSIIEGFVDLWDIPNSRACVLQQTVIGVVIEVFEEHVPLARAKIALHNGLTRVLD